MGSVSFFSPSRCVLLLSDEALHVYDVGAKISRLAGSVLWSDANFEALVAGLIQKECGSKPVVILNDMVEQHYRKERIPKVSPLDRANVVKRRLSVAFANYPVRAALPLSKPKRVMRSASGDDKNLANGDVYLFAAVAMSEPFRMTLEAVKRSLAPIAAYCLLPVESSDLVLKLSKATTAKNEFPSKWVVFIGQHQNGGLRQIVIKDGELALTRMTPIVDTDIEPELWVSEVVAEFQSTMSYLSRFGYSEEDGLDVFVIANDLTKDHLQGRIGQDCNLKVLSSEELAKILGLNIGHQDDLRYADPIHAAWSGRKSKFLLPMDATQISTVSQPRQIAMMATVILIGALGYLGFQVFSGLQDYLVAKNELETAEQKLRSVQQVYQEELERKKELGVDVILVQNSLKIFDSLDNASMRPLTVLKKIGESLGGDLRIDEYEISPASAEKKPAQNNRRRKKVQEAPSKYQVLLKISLPGALEPEKGVARINRLVRQLKQNLPEHDVRIEKQIANLTYTGNFVGEAGEGELASKQKEKKYTAEIKVVGNL